jgi:hypothetical protein
VRVTSWQELAFVTLDKLCVEYNHSIDAHTFGFTIHDMQVRHIHTHAFSFSLFLSL